MRNIEKRHVLVSITDKHVKIMTKYVLWVAQNMKNTITEKYDEDGKQGG